jgi:hypothetical protein
MAKKKKIEEEVVEETLPVEPVFKLTLKVNGEVIETSGDTPLECLNKLQPLKIVKSYGVFSLTKGDKTIERKLTPMKTRQTLFAPIFKTLLAKRFSILK